MTRKTSEAYTAVFEFIEGRLFKFEPDEFMCDFEEGMRLGIRNYWPEVRVRGCWFHYKRAVHKKCTALGMTKFLKHNKTARTVKNMLTNLPLLPSEDVIDGYQIVKRFAERKRMSQRFAGVFRYFEGYWVQQVRTIFSHAFVKQKLKITIDRYS